MKIRYQNPRGRLTVKSSLVALIGGLAVTASSATLDFTGLGIPEGTLFTSLPGVPDITFANVQYVTPGNPRFAFNGNSNGGPGGIDSANTGAFISVPWADGSVGVIRSSSPLADVSLAVLDVDDQATIPGLYEFCTIRLFDAQFGGAELASFTLYHNNPAAGDGIAAPVLFPGITGVHRIEFNGYTRTDAVIRAGYGIDNITFSVVPEPSAGLMVVVGFCFSLCRGHRKMTQ